MGFGLLFLGYFAMTLMTFNPVGVLAQIIGYTLMLVASVKLNVYNIKFRWLAIACGIMIAISCAIAVSDISQFLYDNLIIKSQPFGNTYNNIFNYVQLTGMFLMHTALLASIRSISIETGVLKNAMAAIRNYVFVCLYFVLWLLATTVNAISTYCLIAAVITYFIYAIANNILIFSCYAKICDECDVEMEQKPSRFAFVNKMRAQSQARQAEAQARREEYKKQKKNK